ncbi:MAG: DUF3048 domain-containing protein [Candidatus Dojkabacteria bacterium]|nr:DUF3048 domain-containing protein [Candidatus Dojkabacteria bacterium]
MPKKKTSETNTKEKVSTKRIILISLSIFFFLILVVIALIQFNIPQYFLFSNNTLNTADTNYISANKKTIILSPTLVDIPNKPKTEQSPINGQLFTKEEMTELMEIRPVAVMISNHVDARPVSGLSSADLVIESLVEWGITRNMAFFWSETPKEVGSVRSARQYFLEWLSPYDPLYIHVGCASTTNPRTDACDHLFSYDLKDVSYFGSWRTTDAYAPHNAFSSVTYAREYGDDRDWSGFPKDFESWKFKDDLNISERGDAYRYEIVFHKTLNNRGLYDTIWEYNNLTNSYKRYIGGEIDIDANNGKQITAKTVVIQKIKMESAHDDKGRIIQDTIGEGEAIILMDGIEIYGTWEKTDRMDRTTYYDDRGNEIEFNRGKIWIAAISDTVGDFEIIKN